jgi:polyribonucleotide nucleotidyltransferase
MQKVINAINELTVEAGTKPSDWTAPAKNEALIAALKDAVGGKLAEAFQIRDKLQRRDAICRVKADVVERWPAASKPRAGTRPSCRNSASSNTAPCATPAVHQGPHRRPCAGPSARSP